LLGCIYAHTNARSIVEHCDLRGTGRKGTFNIGATAAATRSMASRLCSTSSAVVSHDETLIRMAFCPCQTVPPHPVE